MNTPTHLIVAAAILAQPGAKRRNLVVAAGALAPDLSIYIFFVWAQLFTDATMHQVWGELYWTEPWQTFGAISNSLPIALLLLGIGLWRRLPLFVVFAAALFVHAGLDFPLHADDAHRHFWPLSSWRFHSPVSYWDQGANGTIGGLIELLTLSAASFVLWRRFPSRWVRATVIGACLLSVATYTRFYFIS